MCCFDPNMCITKYDTIGDILEQFFTYRLVTYEERRQHQISAMKDHLEEVEAKLNFVKAIVENRLKIVNEEDDIVLQGLMKLGLPPRSNRSEPETLEAYEYLLKMRVDRIKKKSVEESENEVSSVKAKLVDLESKTATSIWLEELDDFIDEWNKAEKNMIQILSASTEKVLTEKKKLSVKRLKK
jgi:DNA topoisomerase-2